MDIDDDTDKLAEKILTCTENTKKSIENLENDIKETLKIFVFNDWDPENKEVIDQFENLVDQSAYLKGQLIRKDVEIFRLREILADKRKSLKQSRIGLDSLKTLTFKAEESLFQRDLVIFEQSEKLAGLIGSQRPEQPKKPEKPSESCKSNKFLPINSSNQGIYLTKSIQKLEDRGKQEISMPFLSFSSQNWISSLRTQTKSPNRRV